MNEARPLPARVRVSMARAGVGACVALLVGCSAATPAAKPNRLVGQTKASAPATAPAVSATPRGSTTKPRLRATPVSGATLDVAARTVSTPVPEIVRLALFSHWLAFSAPSRGAHRQPDQVYVLDLDTGKLRQVARSAWPQGQTDWVTGTGDTLVWTDRSRRQSDQDMSAAWTITALNLRTGARQQLSHAALDGDTLVPTPVTGDGWVVWDEIDAPARSGLRVLSWRPGQPQPATFGRHVHMNAGSEAIVRGRLYLIAMDVHDASVQLLRAELPAGRLARVPLHLPGPVMRLAGNGTDLVLERNIGQDEDPGIEHFDDPYAHLLLDPVTGATRQLQRGYSMGNAVVGATFAAWLDRQGGLGLSDLRGNSCVLPAPGLSIAARLAADGDHLAWATSNTIHVLTVTPGGPAH